MTYSVELGFRIYNDATGDVLKVAPDRDGLGLVEIDGGADFGRLVVPPEMARKLADVLGAVAASAEAATP